jgi:hypothetical protein
MKYSPEVIPGCILLQGGSHINLIKLPYSCDAQPRMPHRQLLVREFAAPGREEDKSPFNPAWIAGLLLSGNPPA